MSLIMGCTNSATLSLHMPLQVGAVDKTLGDTWCHFIYYSSTAQRCISHRRHVRPSVCHKLVLCQNDSRWNHAVFTYG